MNTPSDWNGRECVRRMIRGTMAKVATLGRTGELGDVDVAHIRDALASALIEVEEARWRLPPSQGVEVIADRAIVQPLPTEAERSAEAMLWPIR